MICPRCGETIADIETICPFCMQDIDKNAEFNDFRKDGFVQIQTKNEADTSEPINYMPKYFNIAEFNIFVIAFVYILFISLFTVFSYRFVQKSAVEYVPAYVVKTEATTESQSTQPTTPKVVEGYTIKDILGSWKMKGMEETETTAIPYYSFAEDGVAQENYGSITSAGVYKDLSDGDDKIVYINIANSFSGTYKFEIVGNKKKGYSLLLEDISNSRSYELIKASAKAKKLSPAADYKIDKELLGYWLNEENKKSYEFRSDGTAVRAVEGTTTECVWSLTGDHIITIKYMKSEVKSIDFDYVIKGKTLLINNTTYEKQKKTDELTQTEETTESSE